MMKNLFFKGNGKQLVMLQAMEAISSTVKDLGLVDEFAKKCKKEIETVAKTHQLTEMQAVLFSLFVSRCDDRRIRLSEIGGDLGCSTIQMMLYSLDIDELVNRHFIKRKKSDREEYLVPNEVQEALKENKCYEPNPPYCKTYQEFFAKLDATFDKKDDDDLDEAGMHEELNTILETNPQIDFCQKVASLKLDFEERDLLIYFCHQFVNNNDDSVRGCDLKFLYDDRGDYFYNKRALESGEHELMKKKLVEYADNDGFLDKEAFKLSDSSKRHLLAELNLPTLKAAPKQNEIEAKKVVKKELFYPAAVEEQVNELNSLLQPKNFRQIQSRMKQKGMRCGFACLFYGGPGTGKTETVMQLARQTGRDIMLIDIPKVRSCWVGETEKNIKAVFDKYREMVKKSKRAPILLFNEADAIIGIRKEGAERSVDKMENTMQNIILQEMETLDGIMIATTNLTQNLDKAFERRFLYKIMFEKPDVSVRAKIWTMMLPDVSNDIISELSKQFEFSGGQIENIARRYAIDYILHGDSTNTAENLKKYCQAETIAKQNRSKVGFSV
ncbi:MAG: ATP-binding protein [Bacteroidales bacterium]|nr:ATP-binding protein [Bacteroidales bacterium]